MRIRLVIFILSFSLNAFSQFNDTTAMKSVLRYNKIGKEYKFKDQEGPRDVYLKYLGKLTSKRNETFKIVTSISIYGRSRKATPRILIFNAANKYLGNYYVGVISDLPSLIQNNELVFENIGGDCDSKLKTSVSFNDGIPKQFFKKCKGEYGDIFTFSAD